MKRIDYFLPRSLLMFFTGFFMVGTLPRILGIIATKPEFTTLIAVVDTVATVGFLSSLSYTVYAIVHNARLK